MSEIVEEDIRWCAGEGFIDFWYDRWLLEAPLINISSSLQPQHCLVAEYFTNEGSDLPKLREFLPLDVVTSISSIPSFKEEMVWAPSINDDFTISSAWTLIQKKRNFSVVSRGVWCTFH